MTILLIILSLIIIAIAYWYFIGKATSKGFSDEGWEEEEMDLESKKAMAREEK